MIRVRPDKPVRVGVDDKYLYDPSIVDAKVQKAKDWATKTDGMVEEDGVPVDYSAKAHAIGGQGRETNNAKYYAEQAGLSATSASNSATTATTQAGIATTQAGTATTQAGIATIKAGEASASATNAHTSELNAAGSEGRAQIWAEGDDEDVEALGGTHSSLASAGLAYAYANSPEDTPVETFAAGHDVVVQGEKGDDGFSPSASVTQSGGTTTISITDKDGTTTASLTIPTDTSDLTNGAGFITSSALSGYEQEATIETLDATDSITLADNTIYNGGEQTALTIALPATVDVSFVSEVDFSSGSTPTTLSYSLTDIIWRGDDLQWNSTEQKYVFVPLSNKRYTVIFDYDGVNYFGTVRGS